MKDIPPCDPKEGRRVDGSCNNLKNPARGAGHTPFARVLSPVFDKSKISFDFKMWSSQYLNLLIELQKKMR